MGTIVVFENVWLDGVIVDPAGEDWRGELTPADQEQWDKVMLDDALSAQAILLGRRSYEFFVARYPFRTGAMADRMNSLPKYVVSATLADPGWNSTVLGGNMVDAVSTLKRTVDGELRVYASSQLVHTLLERDLVDELRLMIFPLVMGTGKRLLDHSGAPKPSRLIETRTVGRSLSYLRYQCLRKPQASAENRATATT